MNRSGIYIAIIVFLLVTNIVTIFTVSKKRITTDNSSDPLIERPADERIGFLVDQLGLRPDQVRDFMLMNRQFNDSVASLNVRMDRLRHDMVDEMASDNPDTVMLRDVQKEFGSLHTRLKEVTMNYYFSLKTICDQEQQDRLHFVFRDMLNPEGQIYGRGRGGMRRGMRQEGGSGRMRYRTITDTDNN